MSETNDKPETLGQTQMAPSSLGAPPNLGGDPKKPSEKEDIDPSVKEVAEQLKKQREEPQKVHPYNSYLGEVYYDFNGRVIEEVGQFRDHKESMRRIRKCRSFLAGKWAFSLVRTMVQPSKNQPEVWSNRVEFPNGDARPIKKGEMPKELNEEERSGQWITEDYLRKVFRGKLRVVQQTVMPYLTGSITLTKHHFANNNSIIEFLEGVDSELLFYDAAAAGDLEPKEPGMHAYFAIGNPEVK